MAEYLIDMVTDPDGGYVATVFKHNPDGKYYLAHADDVKVIAGKTPDGILRQYADFINRVLEAGHQIHLKIDSGEKQP